MKKKNKQGFMSRVKGFFSNYELYDNNGERIIQEPIKNGWQRNISARKESPTKNFAFFSCITVSSNSIANLPMVLTKKQADGTWQKTENKKYEWLLKLLNRPNPNQSTFQFLNRLGLNIQQSGNAYAWIERGTRGTIKNLWILPSGTTTLKVAPDGEVFYSVMQNDLSGLGSVTLPASEILHFRINCLFFDLLGVAPLHAAAIHAAHGIEMFNTSYDFYKNMAQPSGILTAPEGISTDEARRIKEEFEANKAARHGSVVVMGDGLTYTPVNVSAADQQLIELMKFNAEAICSCFHIPPYKILGNAPTYNNVEALTLEYYNNALKFIINEIEQVLNYGLNVNENFGEDLWIKLDVEDFLSMDTTTRYNAYNNAIKGGWMTPNEARLKEDLAALNGGDTVYMQQQNYSLEALANRDATNPLVAPPETEVVEVVEENEEEIDSSSENEDNTEEELKNFLLTIKKGFE